MGPQGAQGPAGPQGPAGTASATEVYRNGDQDLQQNVDQTVATMASIPAGAYLFVAKTTIVASGVTGFNTGTVTCTLDAGGTTDTSEHQVGEKDGASRGTLHLQLVKSFASTGTAVIRCLSDAGFNVLARHTTIVAVKVDTVSRTAVTG